jgi:peptidoglycan/LPS O-acetylase OafA/YrhL
MNEDTSFYLDAARFLAAFTVMLCHIDEFIVPGLVPFVDHLGVEAVGVFFVLSGFVIGYASEYREKTLTAYTISRAARLYSVVIPCLTLTLILDILGRHTLPALYYGRESVLTEVLHIVFSFSFLNYTWIFSHPVATGNDGPFWSLCFEVPYYLVFGLAFYLRGLRRWLLTGLVLLIAGFNIVGLFPIWLFGLWLYRQCGRMQLKPWTGRMILGLSLVLWAVFEWLLRHFHICPNVPAIIKSGPVLLYGSGLCFGLSVIGFRFSGISLKRLRLGNAGGAIRWLAGATFTLYLLHFPLAWLLGGAVKALAPTAPAALSWLLVAGLTFGLALLTAQFTERRKNPWRRAIEWGILSLRRARPGRNVRLEQG